MTETQTEVEVLQIPPGNLMAENAIRFGLKPSKVEALMADILSQGGVHTPLEVEPTGDEGVYRITDGEYRKTAVERLNKEQGAGLTLPCIVVSNNTPLDRIKRQISHNFQREDMSPMDIATAIKALLDQGVPRIEIRTIFSRPSSKKGGKVQPASNAYINMLADFLLFSKPVQRKIHEGEIGIEAAYMLTKVLKKDPAKLAAVLEELDQQRKKLLAEEEKDEERYLESVKKEEEAKLKLETLQAEAESAAKKFAETSAAFDQAAKAEADAYAAKMAAAKNGDKDTRLAADKAFQEASLKSAEILKQTEALNKESVKLKDKLAAAQAKAEEQRKSMESARKAKDNPKAAKATNKADVQKAAKKMEVDGAGHVALKLQEIRDFVRDGAAAGNFPKVQVIFKSIEQTILGVITDRECFKEVAKITGEYKAGKK
jgi:hypothetical protein